MASLSTVDVDLACIGCGYNLRTLPWEGRCPECTRPVKESVGGWGPVLTSRASVVTLRRALGLYFAGVALEMVVAVAFRVATFFAMQLIANNWYRPFLLLWIDGGAVARVLEWIAIILILFACTPRHAFRFRGLVWVATPVALAFSVAEVIWLIDIHLRRPSGLQALAQTLVSLSSVCGIAVVSFMWLCLRSTVHREKHRWLARLCVLALISELIGLVSAVLYDLPTSLGFEPIIEPEVSLLLGPRAFGGCGMIETIAIFQLGVLWIFVRALQDGSQGKPSAKLGSGVDQFKPV